MVLRIDTGVFSFEHYLGRTQIVSFIVSHVVSEDLMMPSPCPSQPYPRPPSTIVSLWCRCAQYLWRSAWRRCWPSQSSGRRLEEAKPPPL